MKKLILKKMLKMMFITGIIFVTACNSNVSNETETPTETETATETAIETEVATATENTNETERTGMDITNSGEELKSVESQTDEPSAFGPTPSAAQLHYQKMELSAFIHFGMNTFNSREWGNGKESPADFKLMEIDAEQWVSAFKDAGFGRMILVAKHHDGFCNWPSEFTEHSVKNSPGQIDVVGAVSAACTKYDMEMGIYLSPYDQNAKGYGSSDQDVYNNYYMNQLKEILGNPNYGNNGKFAEVWMDGASPSTQRYYFTKEYNKKGDDNWFDTILSFNPETVIFCPIGATVRWNGTESGYSSLPCWNKINWSTQKAYYDKHYGEDEAYVGNGDPNGVNWSVPEADVSIVPGWFDYNGTPKTMSTLGDIYFSSVGRASVLLLNAAPGKDGRISEAQENRIREFGEAIKNTFAVNMAENANVTADSVRNNNEKYSAANVVDGDYDTYWTMDDDKTTGSITIDLGEEKTFDVVSIQEYIPLGQRVVRFSIEVFSAGKWKGFGDPTTTGQTIGYKALVRDGVVTASQVRINILESQAVPVINSIGVYKADKAFEITPLKLPDGVTFIDCTDDEMKYTGKWSIGNGMQSLNDTHKWSAGANDAVTFTFTGTNFYIIGISDPGHGSAEVLVDGNSIGKANFYSKNRRGHQMIYASPSLEYGTHEVTLRTISSAIDFDGAYYADFNGITNFTLDSVNYTALHDAGVLEVKVIRNENIDKPASVVIYTEPGTGVHGKVYNHISQTVEFEPGETEKTVAIEIVEGEENSGKDFYIKLELTDENDILNTPSQAAVLIR